MGPTDECRCCGASARIVLKTQDFGEQLSDTEFFYARCEDCDAYQLANIPDDLGSYYPISYYDHIDSSVKTDDAEIARGQLATFSHIRTSGRLIDIGPATGGLLAQARLAGFTSCSAVEQDARCCEMLRAAGFDVVKTDDPIAGLAALEPADVVTMFQLIEHVRDPMGLLDAAAAKVLPGGLLVVATPNPSALSFRVCGSLWGPLEAPRHLYLLPLDLVRRRVESCGLGLLSVTTQDLCGRINDKYAWTTWAQHLMPGARSAYHFRNLVHFLTRGMVRRDMRGSTYTAIFQR